MSKDLHGYILGQHQTGLAKLQEVLYVGSNVLSVHSIIPQHCSMSESGVYPMNWGQGEAKR